jgi:HAMP domain-containing protein
MTGFDRDDRDVRAAMTELIDGGVGGAEVPLASVRTRVRRRLAIRRAGYGAVTLVVVAGVVFGDIRRLGPATHAVPPAGDPTATVPTDAPSIPTSSPSLTQPQPGAVPVVPPCTGNLSVTVGSSGAAAGHTAWPIIFTNLSKTDTCSLTGYPVLDLVDSTSGAGVPTTPTLMGYIGGLTGDLTEPPTVILGPGQSAAAIIEGDSMDGGSGASCPMSIAVSSITPPGWDHIADGGPTATLWGCGLEIHPVVPGTIGRLDIATDALGQDATGAQALFCTTWQSKQGQGFDENAPSADGQTTKQQRIAGYVAWLDAMRTVAPSAISADLDAYVAYTSAQAANGTVAAPAPGVDDTAYQAADTALAVYCAAFAVAH